MTVHIPLSTLARLTPDGFGWMVPGLREELVTATIRSLPKPVRVQLVPAPDVARGVDAWMTEHTADWEDTVRAGDAAPSFRDVFRRAVRELREVDVPEDAFDDDRLPPHLRMTFRVVGDRGGVVDEGKDLAVLQRRLAAQTQQAVDDAVRTAVRAAMEEARKAAPAQPEPQPAPTAPPAPAVDVERTGLTTWPADLPELPEVVAIGTVRAYPSLVEEKGTVAVRALADESAVPEASRRGLRRLLLLDVGLATGRITTRWTGTQALTLAASPYPSTEALVRDVQLAAIESLLTSPATSIRTLDAYTAVRTAVRDRLEGTVFSVVTDLVAVLTAWRELDAEIRSRSSLALLATAQDIRAQAARLVHDGFVSETGADRLPHLTRYLKAARHRLVKAADNPQRDADLAWQVRDVEALYDDAVAERPHDPEVTAVRWLLEELRVSLFAQQLGTPVPVSTTRVKKALTSPARA